MNNSYIMSHYKVTEEQYKFIASYTKELNLDTHKLFCHILISSLIKVKRREEGWSPIPWITIQKKLRDARWEELQVKGLIEVENYSRAAKLCREYKINQTILSQFISTCPIIYKDYKLQKKVNLFTGKITKSINKSRFTDKTNNNEPELIINAIKNIEYCIINIKQVEDYLISQQSLLNSYKLDSKEYIKQKARLYNDIRCLQAIYQQEPEELGEGFYKYIPAYEVQMAGRISQVGGALQSCTREMKQAAYTNVENIKNYDLKSSQPNGLIQQFDLASLDTTWLKDYINNSNAKTEYADYLGISVNCWKNCLCSLMMGAYMPKNIKISNGSIADYLYDELKEDNLVLEAFIKFMELVKPLKSQIDLWHNWLLEHYVPTVAKKHKGKTYLYNPTGKFLCIEELSKKESERKSKLAAFVLQGQEAALIHHLTILSLKYKYKVLTNEHDGLVVLGIIPHQAVEQACRLSGSCTATLVEKSFV